MKTKTQNNGSLRSLQVIVGFKSFTQVRSNNEHLGGQVSLVWSQNLRPVLRDGNSVLKLSSTRVVFGGSGPPVGPEHNFLGTLADDRFHGERHSFSHDLLPVVFCRRMKTRIRQGTKERKAEPRLTEMEDLGRSVKEETNAMASKHWQNREPARIGSIFDDFACAVI